MPANIWHRKLLFAKKVKPFKERCCRKGINSIHAKQCTVYTVQNPILCASCVYNKEKKKAFSIHNARDECPKCIKSNLHCQDNGKQWASHLLPYCWWWYNWCWMLSTKLTLSHSEMHIECIENEHIFQCALLLQFANQVSDTSPINIRTRNTHTVTQLCRGFALFAIDLIEHCIEWMRWMNEKKVKDMRYANQKLKLLKHSEML